MPSLLSIIELGGYPNFEALYHRLGFSVQTVPSIRKALKIIKATPPDVIVAEFNFQSDFRDRTSSLESLMSLVSKSSKIKTLIFYDVHQQHQFARLKKRFNFDAEIVFPIDDKLLEERLRSLTA